MNTIKHTRKAGFSLIELMIVVVIIGALTAIILPQFNASESEAKDAGCDASNYGTLRQLVNFKSINGVYPSRLHTGFEDAAATTQMGDTDGVSALAAVTATNLVNETTLTTLDNDTAGSLIAAGIDYIAAGGFGIDATFTEVTNGVAVRSVTDDWYETHDESGIGEEGTEVTINGLPIWAYASSDPQLDYADGDTYSDLTTDGIVVPLICAPTVDWDHAVVDGTSMDSKVGVAQAGGCPWLEGGTEFRYYIAFFKVYDDEDTPAKLIGTACPECGSLNP